MASRYASGPRLAAPFRAASLRRSGPLVTAPLRATCRAPSLPLLWAPSGPPIFRVEPERPDRTRMPRARKPATARPSPYENAGSAAINAMVERVAPAILELLADDMPRSKPAIVAALAGRHDKQDVVNALIRLAVTGEVEQTGAKYTLATPSGDGPPEAA